MNKFFINIILIFLCSLFFSGFNHAQELKKTTNYKLLSSDTDLNINLQFFLDGKEEPISHEILNSLKFIPLEELDDGIISTLLYTNLYQDITVKTGIKDSKKNVFLIYATSKKFINEVVFNGISLNEDQDIRRMFQTQKNLPYNEAEIVSDSKNLIKILFDKGYTNAKIDSIEITETDLNSVKIIFNINKGPICKIEQVTVKDSFSNILNFINVPIETGSPCDLKIINDAIEQNKENLYSEGYLNAEVKVANISYSQNKDSAKIILQINRGIKTTFQIVDEDISAVVYDFFESKQRLTYSDLILLSDSDLRAVLVNYYLKQGYAFVNINGPVRSTDATGNLNLKFNVRKGPVVKIGKVSFLGELPEPEDDILKKLNLNESFFSPKPLFVESNLFEYKNKLNEIFMDNGYTEAKISGPDYIPANENTTMNLIFGLQKGKRFLVHEIKISNNNSEFSFDMSELDPILSPEIQINLERKNRFAEECKKQLISSGYLYSRIAFEQKKYSENETVSYNDIIVNVTTGPIVKIGKVTAEGDLFAKEKVIISISDLDEGDIFTPENIEAGRNRILRRELFSSVIIEPSDPSAIERRETVINLVIRTRARSGFNLGLSPGYGTLRGYRFTTDYTLNKLNDDGLRFVSSAGVSQEKQQQNFASSNTKQILGQNLNLGLSEPLFKVGQIYTPIDLSSVAGYQVAAETLTNRRYLTLQLNVDWKPSFFDLDWNFRVSFLHENSYSTSAESAIIQTLDSPSITIHEVVASLSLDTRNNYAWPTKGGVYSFKSGITRFGFGSNVQYNRYAWDGSFYFPIYKRLSGAILFGGISITDVLNQQGSTVTPPGSRRATLTEDALIRGFPESYGNAAPGPLLWIHYFQNNNINCATQLASIGATNLLYLKAETRYRINNNFGMIFFLDTGENYFSNSEINLINKQIQSQIAPSQNNPNSTYCIVDKAKLVIPSPLSSNNKNFLQEYWNMAYASTGLGFRMILGNYATVSVDYGYPLKDPSTRFGTCQSASQAIGSSTAPECISRIQDSYYLWNNVKIRGAFHLGVGAKF